MLTQFVFIMMLMLPGMSEPKIQRSAPLASFDECMERVKAAGALAKEHEGEPYKFLAGCEMTGNKADPA